MAIKHIILDTNDDNQDDNQDDKNNAIVMMNPFISYFLEKTSWIIEIHI
ncbi:MAG: hypothetical protein WCB31_01930 [Nitrososphaeraceae archaeon]